jgi:hypothetical protein
LSEKNRIFPKNRIFQALIIYLDNYNNQRRLNGWHEEMIVVRATGIVERIDTIELGFSIG